MEKIFIGILMVTTLILSAYMHERDLIRHCIEEGTMHTWDSEYIFECKPMYLQKN